MTDALPPANWYPDPDDPRRQRYWDGTAWTEHRAPGPGASAADTLARAGNDIAEGVAGAFTAAEGWFRQQSAAARTLTIADVAARCRDDAPHPPLDRVVDLVVGSAHVDPVRRVFAEASLPITADGTTLDAPCRLVPNPWDPARPDDIAVLVRQHQVAMLPPVAAAEYRTALVALTQRQLLAVGEISLRATWNGAEVTATATARLPQVGALG